MFTDLVPMGMSSMFRDFDREFEDIVKSARAGFNEAFPPINVSYSCVADDQACYIEMALAGYSKDEISVEVSDNKVTVSAKIAEPEEEEAKDTLRTNRKYLKQRVKKQSFTRTYLVPTAYNLEATEVTYENGLLTVVIPAKKQEEPKTKKLEIK